MLKIKKKGLMQMVTYLLKGVAKVKLAKKVKKPKHLMVRRKRKSHLILKSLCDPHSLIVTFGASLSESS